MKLNHRGLLLVAFLALAFNALAQGPASLVVNEFGASNSSIIADGDGDYSDWIELYNPTTAVVALSGCYLSDDATNLSKWVFPASAAISIPAGGYLIVYASGKGTAASPFVDSQGRIHTSFKLSAGGESVLLVAADGSTVISSIIDYPEQQTDVSYGVGANSVTGFMSSPTPGAANGNAGGGWVADTNWSAHRGFYSAPFTVAITCDTPQATIKYTLDCSTPSETNGTIYSGTPISVTGTTVLRAMAYKSGWFSTDVDTQTYIFIANTIAQPATKPNSLWPDPYKSSGGPPGGGSSKQAIDYGMDTKVTANSLYSGLMDSALRAVPTISIVTDLPNLFNTTTGIYANADGEGDAWERPACVEMINADGSDAFHVNTGLRIRGGSSTAKTNPKHSFRIIMRSDYGDSKIKYPLFGPTGPDTFDKLDFRTAQNFSWQNTNPQYANWLDDPFSRDTMRDMGHPYTNGFFFHLYLDGVYWGLYQTEERPDAYFAQSYLGGAEEDYDAIKADDDTGIMYETDGTMALHNAYWTIVNAGVTATSTYFQLQGKNADGTTNTAYTRYLDVDNLIDYMLIVFFTGAQDMPIGPPNSSNMPRNVNLVVNHTTPDGCKYLPHDNEWSLLRDSGVNVNRVSVSLASALGTQTFFNPWWLHSKLKANSEYALKFADRVHKHFFNNGALTPAVCTARYQTRIDEIDLAIIAESARWGDYLSVTTARTRNTDWLPSVNWIKNSFFNASPSTRTSIVLAQLKTAGLYPTVDAPEFNQNGGTVSGGFNLTVTAAAGTIYYTTDGSDPRQIGGAVTGSALSGSSGLGISLITPTVTVKARARNGSVWSALTEADFVVTGSSVPDWALY